MSQNGGATNTYRCDDQNGSCNGLWVPCDDRADCQGNQVCCGVLDTGTNQYVDVSCTDSCDPNQNQYEFCDPNAQPDECAKNGQTCSLASGVLTGYYRCQ